MKHERDPEICEVKPLVLFFMIWNLSSEYWHVLVRSGIGIPCGKKCDRSGYLSLSYTTWDNGSSF